MNPIITCATCRYFRPDASNPSAAMGRCYADARHGYFFANEHHRCVDHSAEAKTKLETAKGE